MKLSASLLHRTICYLKYSFFPFYVCKFIMLLCECEFNSINALEIAKSIQLIAEIINLLITIIYIGPCNTYLFTHSPLNFLIRFFWWISFFISYLFLSFLCASARLRLYITFSIDCVRKAIYSYFVLVQSQFQIKKNLYTIWKFFIALSTIINRIDVYGNLFKQFHYTSFGNCHNFLHFYSWQWMYEMIIQIYDFMFLPSVVEITFHLFRITVCLLLHNVALHSMTIDKLKKKQRKISLYEKKHTFAEKLAPFRWHLKNTQRITN